MIKDKILEYTNETSLGYSDENISILPSDGTFDLIIRNIPIDLFKQILERQCHKGLSKYGHTLDACPQDKFNWQQMMIEKLVDYLQYYFKFLQYATNI